MRWRKNPYWQALVKHYTAPMRETFKQFRLGFAFFLVGGVMIYGAQQLLPPSLAQEVWTLLGMVIGLTGFILALMAQMRLLISRIINFIRDK